MSLSVWKAAQNYTKSKVVPCKISTECASSDKCDNPQCSKFDLSFGNCAKLIIADSTLYKYIVLRVSIEVHKFAIRAHPITLHIIQENWYFLPLTRPELEELLMFIADNGGNMLVETFQGDYYANNIIKHELFSEFFTNAILSYCSENQEFYIELMSKLIKLNSRYIEHAISASIPYTELCKLCMVSSIKRNANILKYVGKSLQSQEMCELAVLNSGGNIKYIAAKIRVTEEMALSVLKNNGNHIKYLIGKVTITEEMALCAVTTNSKNFKLLPARLQNDPNIILAAVTYDPSIINIVPVDKINSMVASIAIDNNMGNIIYVPKSKLTREQRLAAVKADIKYFPYSHKDMQTNKLCLNAVKANVANLYHIKRLSCLIYIHEELDNYSNIVEYARPKLRAQFIMINNIK